MTDGTVAFWDSTCDTQGHTGWADVLVYRYDQPLRIRAVARAMERLFPDGLAGMSVLDVGCGTGDFIAVASGRGARVVGLDLSPHVIDRARARFAGSPEVTLQVGSVVEARFVAGAFDLVTSVTVLQHITDDAALDVTLTALRQALKPGGRLLLLELAPPFDKPVHHLNFPVVERPLARWVAALQRAGFVLGGEGTYPQAGISMLRGIARVLDAVRGGASEHPAAPIRDTRDGTRRSGARRIARSGWDLSRRLTLAVCHPVDHGLSMATPARWRYTVSSSPGARRCHKEQTEWNGRSRSTRITTTCNGSAREISSSSSRVCAAAAGRCWNWAAAPGP